jgi:hypothetical protein
MLVKSNNIIKKITNINDLEVFSAIAKKLIEKPCWQTRISYGDELCLDFGLEIPYGDNAHKFLAGKKKGEWEFGTRGTDWQLISAPGNILTSSAENVEVFKSKVKILEGTNITKFETDYPDLVLTIGFSNSCELKIFPDLEDDSEVSCWELFTPDNMLLTLEPGGIWTYTRSDVPMGEKING